MRKNLSDLLAKFGVLEALGNLGNSGRTSGRSERTPGGLPPGMPPELAGLFGENLFGDGDDESDTETQVHEIELPEPAATTDLTTLVTATAESLEFLTTIGGACALRGNQISKLLPTRRPESIEELHQNTEVGELLSAFQAALTAANLVKAQSPGSEELFDAGIQSLEAAITQIETLQDYDPETAQITVTFNLTVTGTRADVQNFERLYNAAREKLEVDAVIACAQAYGHKLSICDDTGALLAESDDQDIEIDPSTIDFRQALSAAGVTVEDDVEVPVGSQG
jgi:hypothetical protein